MRYRLYAPHGVSLLDLAAIRSSAELLRDEAIGPAERNRFAEIVLSEERRPGALLVEMIEGRRRSPP